ncbi:MAG: Ig-like domain-containing protein [Cyclobacteriaceae bacterium]
MMKMLYNLKTVLMSVLHALQLLGITKKVIYLLIILVSISNKSTAQLVVSQLFSNNAVVQQGQPIRVWGTDTPGNTVTCSIDGQVGTSFVSAEGDWFVELPNTLTFNQSYIMDVSNGSTSLQYNELVLGDVWIATGQSNMEWTFATIENGQNYGSLPANMQEVKTDAFPNIRMLDVQTIQSAKEERMLLAVSNTDKNRWYKMTDYARISKQSAVAYYLARTLHLNLNYPIGIIVSAVGGTFIEEWTSKIAEDEVIALGITLDPNSSTNGRLPRARFNAMISPLIPASVSGVVWYQGESNGGSAPGYAEKTLACFNDWQNRWGQKLPVYTTILAGFVQYNAQGQILGGNSGYVRSEQLMAAGSYDNDSIYLTSAIDLGVEDNIHPPYKKEVGERHAAYILHHMDSQTYPEPVYPRVTNCVRNGSEAIFTLDQPVDQSTLAPGMFQAFRGWLDEIPATATYIDPTHVRLVTDNGEAIALAEYNHSPWADNHLTLNGLPMYGYSTWFQPTQTYNYNYSGTQYQFTNSFDPNVTAPTLVIDTVGTSPVTITYNNVSPPDGTGAQLKVINNVPGRLASDHYTVRIKFSSEPETAFRDAYVLQTTADNEVGSFASLIGWTASWATFESDFNGDVVEVEISKKNGLAITQAMVRPVGDASAATIVNGKAYLTFTEPANVNVDIDGQMEDNYTGMGNFGAPYAGAPVHTISIFGNPIYKAPSILGSTNTVIEVNPGDPLPTDRTSPYTIIFKPGVHDIGNGFEINDDDTLYIPGDAIVHGTIHPATGANGQLLWGAEASERFRVYGSGTISGEHNVWAGDGIYANKTFTYTASDAVLEGFVVIDPANHTFNMNEAYGNGSHVNTYKNLKILGWRANSDGINAFRNSVVTDCFFRVQDDAFYLGMNNVIQQNNVVWNDANGSVLYLQNIIDGSSNVFSDVKVIYHRAEWHYWTGGRIISMRQTNSSAIISNVHVQNILVEDPLPAFPPFYGTMRDDNVTNVTLNNIVFENIVQYSDGVIRESDNRPVETPRGKPQNNLIGAPNAIWENITFKNCQFNGVTLTSFADGNFDYANVDETTVIFEAGAAVSGVVIDNCPGSITAGTTFDLNETVNPIDAANKSVIWSSSDETIATVDANGLVTAVALGIADITVTTNDGGFISSCSITVNPLYTDMITIASWPSEVSAGEMITVSVNYEASEALEIRAFLQLNEDPWTNHGQGIFPVAQGSGNMNISFTASDPVSEGVGRLKFVASLRPVGGNWITKRAFDEKTGVDGLPSTISVTAVSINNCAASSIIAGSTYDLNETVGPFDASNKSVTWSSSNTSVATVDANGVITAVALGNADITVTSNDGGFTDVCTVSVVALTDAISILSWPDQIALSETIEVSVDYTASEPLEIRAFIQLNSDPWTNYGQTIVPAPQGSTQGLQVQVTAPSVPDANFLGLDALKVVVSLRPVGGNWSTKRASDQKAGIDGVAGSGSTMSAQSITESTQSAGQGNKRAVAIVLVHDNNGNPVANATVSGDFSGDYNEAGSAVTGANGIATITTTGTAKGAVNFNFCVSAITHATLTYSSMNNVVTCSNDPGARQSFEGQLSKSDVSLKLYPNPVDKLLNFEFGEEAHRIIRMYNMAGKLLFSFETNQNSTQINVRSLNISGAIIIKIRSGGLESNHKVLVR